MIRRDPLHLAHRTPGGAHRPSRVAPHARPRAAGEDRGTAPERSERVQVLLPLDGSALGLRALPHVVRLLDPARHHLTLLRVGPPPDPPPSAPVRPMSLPGWPGPGPSEAELDLQRHPIYDSQLWDAFRTELSDDMADELQQLKDAGFEVTLEVRIGDPVREILSAAEERGADLIVMTTHGRSGLSRALAGSVTEGVLRRAPVPVLALRPGSG